MGFVNFPAGCIVVKLTIRKFSLQRKEQEKNREEQDMAFADFQALYKQKLTTADEAVKVIKSGDWVDYGFCAIHPPGAGRGAGPPCTGAGGCEGPGRY